MQHWFGTGLLTSTGKQQCSVFGSGIYGLRIREGTSVCKRIGMSH
jgi:hypothetical protein